MSISKETNLFKHFSDCLDFKASFPINSFLFILTNLFKPVSKGFLHWKADILTEFDPFETGLNKFVNMNKNEFIGKEALKFRQSEKCLNKLVSLEIDTKHAPAHGGATVSIDNKVVGTITSGDWGHRINKNIAYAFIKSEYSSIGTETFVDILGEKISAEIIEPCPYDPNFDIIKS